MKVPNPDFFGSKYKIEVKIRNSKYLGNKSNRYLPSVHGLGVFMSFELYFFPLVKIFPVKKITLHVNVNVHAHRHI